MMMMVAQLLILTLLGRSILIKRPKRQAALRAEDLQARLISNEQL